MSIPHYSQPFNFDYRLHPHPQPNFHLPISTLADIKFILLHKTNISDTKIPYIKGPHMNIESALFHMELLVNVSLEIMLVNILMPFLLAHKTFSDQSNIFTAQVW